MLLSLALVAMQYKITWESVLNLFVKKNKMVQVMQLRWLNQYLAIMMVQSYCCAAIPLVTKESLEALLKEHKNSGAASTILTAHMPDPTGYGRIIRNEAGSVVRM